MSTQMKIMWAIGSTIIVVILSGTYSVVSTMSELNRTIGNLQGDLRSNSQFNKSLGDQLKDLTDQIRTQSLKKTGTIDDLNIPKIWDGGEVINPKDLAALMTNYQKFDKRMIIFTQDGVLADQWTKSGAVKTLQEK